MIGNVQPLEPLADGTERWLIRMDVGKGRKRQSRTIRGSRAEAELELARWQVAFGEGRLRGAGAVTLEAFAPRWLRLGAADWEDVTHKNYESTLRNHIVPALGATPMDQITPLQIQEFYLDLSEQLSSASVHAAHRVLRALLGTAERLGEIDRSPMPRVRAPKKRTVEHPLPTSEKITDLFTLVADDRLWEMYFRLAFATGARRGELCALQWSEVDLDAGMVGIYFTMSATERGGYRRKETKTGKRRRVDIDGLTLGMLTSYKAWRVENFGPVAGDDHYVFFGERTTDNGEIGMRPDRATQKWSSVRSKVGMHPKTRLHDLRHRSVSMQIAAGWDPIAVAHRHGHSVQMVMEVYGHLMQPQTDRRPSDDIVSLE